LLSHLLGLFESSLPPPERADAGRLLGRLGDPRPEVLAVDEMALCWVPAGPFWLGSDPKHDRMAGEDETPVTRIDLSGYYIGRYPVSNAQFAEFVAAGGYCMERLWREARHVGVWNEGRVQARNDDAGRNAPYDFGAPFNLPNHPVVGVTWHEALAFVRWLSGRWRDQGRLPGGFEVTLPTEAQWEKAARGDRDQRAYPWGDAFEPSWCNSYELGIGTTTPVGTFPSGASPYGVLDMSGNVWEWCLTKWRDDYSSPVDDSPKGNEARVLRGGAFGDSAGFVRCTSRSGLNPDLRLRNYGFRVVARVLGGG
jgi:formylglycine-generating enzyme required for sulfatase activity